MAPKAALRPFQMRALSISDFDTRTVLGKSKSEMESALIWKGRKAAFGAMGRLSDYMCMDDFDTRTDLGLHDLAMAMILSSSAAISFSDPSTSTISIASTSSG